MTKWQYIKFLTRTLFAKKKEWDLKTGHTMELAFYSGGEPYYRLSDLFNTFSERGLEAYQYYEELSMRIDKPTLKAYLKQLKKLLNSNPIEMTEIFKLVGILEERIDLEMIPSSLIYRMGAVAYMSKDENPYTFDPVYAEKKIKKWKINGDVDDFFLSQQLRDMIPLQKLSKETYQQLQRITQKIIEHQSKRVFQASPKAAESFSSNGKE